MAGDQKPTTQSRQTAESGARPAQAGSLTAQPSDKGLVIEGFYPANIVRMRDGSLITENGWHSTDAGRTWRKDPGFRKTGLGLLRLPNAELGIYFVDKWNMATALGNDTNNWYFCWSADEGKTWSNPVQITLPGLTMGLFGTVFCLRDGRVLLVTYSQFIASRFDKRGGSWGAYKGVRFQTETEGHFPVAEVCRVYYSDDNGRHWKASDGWIMGWRDNRWTDAFTEACGVELKDGRILLMGRALTGRLYQAFSDDRGYSWWPGAHPTALMSSYSPCRIARLPKTGDILCVWNQLSRSEIRRGLRRCRLSCAVSRDEGQTWEHFKNIEAIKSLDATAHLPPDPDMTPVLGDDEVGEVPDDFAVFHYPSISVVGNEVFVSYARNEAQVVRNKEGKPSVSYRGGARTRILPADWFYG